MYADNIGSNVFWTALASSIKLWTLNFSLRLCQFTDDQFAISFVLGLVLQLK